MDKIITDFIDSLIAKCMENPALASQRENLESFFYRMVVEILIDNLNEAQVIEIKDMDIASQEAQDKLQLFASQIPGFVNILDEKLSQEAENISKSGQIPS